MIFFSNEKSIPAKLIGEKMYMQIYNKFILVELAKHQLTLFR